MIYPATSQATKGSRHELRVDESGAILWISLALLVPLIVIAAFVLDLASAYLNRTELQQTVDIAALAAAQDLPDTAAAVSSVKAYALDNYGFTETDWQNCSDPEPLEITVPTGHACITFSANFTKVRVQLPPTDVPTAFARLIGHESFTVGAAATAGTFSPADQIQVLPATVTAQMGTGLLCIENAGNNVDCGNRTSGNFGSINAPRLEVLVPASGSDFDELAINYAMNLDHGIEPWDGTASRVCDGKIVSPCLASSTQGQMPNHLVISTGNDIRPVTEGYVTGFTTEVVDHGILSFCGRLTRPDLSNETVLDTYPGDCLKAGEPTMQLLGNTINGRHIYYWMKDHARAAFYPEVVALGYSDESPQLVSTNPVFHAGDARLDCFVAGYRWDPATTAETIPHCLGTTAQTVEDDFEVVGSLSNSTGSEPWLGDWTPVGTPATVDVYNGAIVYETFRNSDQGSWQRSFDASTAMASNADLTVELGYNHNRFGNVDGRMYVYAVNEAGSSQLLLVNDGTTAAQPLLTVSVPHSFLTPTMTIEVDFVNLANRYNANGSDFMSLHFIRISWDAYNSSPATPIFKGEMTNDPRYSVIPRVSSWATNGDHAAPLDGFWSAYTYNIYATNTKVAGFDGWVMDPGLIENYEPSSNMSFGFSPTPRVQLVD